MLDRERCGNTHGSHIRWIAAVGVGAIVLCFTLSAHADYIVPANATTSLNGGTLNLSCTDLIVAGTLNVGSGAVRNARNVTIQPGGVISGGSGSIDVSRNWSVSAAGQFVPGTSDVRFVETCGPGTSVISGSTTFYNVHFTSTTGKAFAFAVNSTQTIIHLFEFTGTATAPSQFLSSAAGQVAYIDLQPGGTQTISHVGVTDVWAIGQWLAPLLTNEGGGGNARRWFGVPSDVVTPIPTLDARTLIALSALLAGIAVLELRRRSRLRKNDGSKPIGSRSGDH